MKLICGIVGSLRKGSFNRGLMNAAIEIGRDAGPAAIMGASTGMSGTIRAQLALRQSFLFTDTFALRQPEILIPRCADRFDGEGKLTDQSTRDLIGRQMQKFTIWIDAVGSATRIGAT